MALPSGKVRVSVDVTPAEHRALKRAQAEDDVTHMMRMRALLRLWRDDTDLQGRVLDALAELRVEDARPPQEAPHEEDAA